MAIRTNVADVKAIMENCTVADATVTSLITAASAIVDKVFEDDTEMTDTLLTEVERWLTAHMIACSLQRSTSRERLGDAEVSYTGDWGKLLDMTPYGQMVKTLDITGNIANLGRRLASIYVVPQYDK